MKCFGIVQIKVRGIILSFLVKFKFEKEGEKKSSCFV